MSTLVAAIEARGPLGPDPVVASARTYLETLAGTTRLDVRTIVPSAGSAAPAQPFVISGTTPSGAGSQAEAFVLDVSSLPSGSSVHLDNIEFVSVIGSASIVGGDGDNYAVGDDATQYISLGVGDDTLAGGGGNDIVGSGEGVDYLQGDGGNDIVFGGSETDTVLGGANEDVVYGNQGTDLLYGNQGLDTLYGGQEADLAYGGQHADIVYGNLGADTLYGNLGADTLYGGQGDDLLYGGSDAPDAYADILYGNQGNDTLIAGEGDDVLYGGAGADRFEVGSDGIDIVADFSGADGDVVAVSITLDRLTAVLAGAVTTASGDAELDLGPATVVRFVGIAADQLTLSMFDVI